MSTVSKPGIPGQLTDPSTPSVTIKPDTYEGLCRLAIRDDGRLLLSLDDLADGDLTGRDVLQYVLLTHEETERAMTRTTEALLYVGARTANELPKRPP